MKALVDVRHRATSSASKHSSNGSKPGSRASSVDESTGNGKVENSANEDDTTVVEPEQGNILMHIISQLRPGADLSRVVLPTFILEPRSMLERITNFMCHPEMLLPIPKIEDPVERFVAVVKFYLSGWHIRPPGVKKPLNPILGEVFTCYWDFDDGTRAYYVAEQTSHHPPKSSYFYMVPEHQIRIDGTLKPRSRFLGNSAASLMEGVAIISLLGRGENPTKGERYILTQPNMYARGILFGKMKYELGDHSYVRCPELGLSADIDFKTKGYFGGVYNAIGGYIKNDETGELLYELSGLWSDEMFIRDMRTGQKEMFFNAHTAKPTPPLVRPIEDQDERESQRLWATTAKAVRERNHELATDEKTRIEDRQREEAAARINDGVDWHPRLFRRIRGGPGGTDEGEEDLEWILNANIDGKTPKEQSRQIEAIYPIVKGQKADERHAVVARRAVARDKDAAKAETSEAGNAKPAAHEEEDLIDFGQHDEKSEPEWPPTAETGSDGGAKGKTDAKGAGGERPSSTKGEIAEILDATGKAAPDSPLIDFHEDLKNAVPSETAKPAAATAGIKRTDTSTTEESADEFHDAEE